MPVGIQRLNAKKSHPNDRIVFIKPLPGPDEDIARDFLERIAAQCLPIMREHHLSVMTLEEYEPNKEFVGRNFNAGEVIQLVLKARFTGHWLPFHYVQMVMMHELAHCKQMNHSRAFWAVRNQYANQMRQLWTRGYTGDGIWGRGALLSSGEWEKNTVQPGEDLPEHLCGGTYRSRRRKRKAKQALSYQEQKQRRILKKFGPNGVALGEDPETKQKLEKGRHVTAKPRVAGSARGRELRAAAALARFDQQKKQKEKEAEAVSDKVRIKAESVDDSDGEETASDADSENEDLSQPDAVETDGTKITDSNGRGMIKVCEDENPDDQDAQNELFELQSSFYRQEDTFGQQRAEDLAPRPTKHQMRLPAEAREETRSQARQSSGANEAKVSSGSEGSEGQAGGTSSQLRPKTKLPLEPVVPVPESRHCTVCSFANDRSSLTCGVCANVLDPSGDVGAWRCESLVCGGSAYLNAGDCGVCGICNQRRPAKRTVPLGG
ncbi:hypothetical protein VTK73DRAFT_4969 [Phialemonium thermophilum]|uniref:WLM domain-containing protein n=1 Tax=Phialemonium thermophilum TaxID=223376 RepID=A0ABR3XYH4_9PEZI